MARRTVSPRQFDRFKRMYSQPFFVLACEVGPAEMSFTVSGSERDAYRLRLVRETGRITCSCRDACVNGARLGCICKHACFLLYRVLRLGDVSPMTTRALTAALFDGLAARAAQVVATAGGGADDGEDGVAEPATAVLSESEIDRLCDAIEAFGPIDAVLEPQDRPRPVRGARLGRPFADVARPPEPEGECPVCYDALRMEAGDLRGCPSCGQAVHARCARRWLAGSRRATCVYCRSPAWAEWDRM